MVAPPTLVAVAPAHLLMELTWDALAAFYAVRSGAADVMPRDFVEERAPVQKDP
jgi:hypothetical protein